MKLFRKIKQLLCAHHICKDPYESFRNDLVVKYALECVLCGHIEELAIANTKPLEDLIIKYRNNQNIALPKVQEKER